jgi:hypothetical protein
VFTSGTITTGLIPTLTAGTTTGTAGIFTSGTVATLNSTTGTITNLSTTLAGDFTITQGTGTIGTGVVTAAKMANPQYTGFRNRIINGDMRIYQRNSGASQTFTAAAALAYAVDRFYGYCTGANVTGQRVAGTTPNEFAYRFTGAASVTAIGFGTRLEATNTIDLAGSTATLSVQLANSLLTTVTWTAFYASTTDAFGTLASPTRTQIATGTFSVTSTLTRYSTQISIPSAATTGIEIVFTVGAQTSGTWTIDNVQLEAGSTATDFERRPIGTELALCQRYYENNYPSGYAVASDSTNNGSWFGVAINTFDFYDYGRLDFQVTKRANPTINLYNPIGGNANFQNLSSNSAQGNAGSRLVGLSSASLYSTNNGLTGGIAFSIRYAANAEL